MSRLARGLAALGIEPGDRVALVSENRPEWVIADLAIMSAGAVTVPAYVTNTVEDHRHILGNSGARAGDRLDRGARRARHPGRRAGAERARGHRDGAGGGPAGEPSICAAGTKCWRSAAPSATTSPSGSRR